MPTRGSTTAINGFGHAVEPPQLVHGVADALDVPARRALVLHDRRPVVDLIAKTLNHGLFVVQAAHDLLEAKAILAGWQPHLAVVDMDHDDSTALLHRLGALNTLTRSLTPALGLVAHGDLSTKLRSFERGVDDVLTMPFSPDELLARALVLSRRAAATDRLIVPVVTIGDIEVDIAKREIRTGSAIVALSRIEQHVLYLLASRAGRIVTRDEILSAVWGPDAVPESNVVDRHIRSLRVKLNDDYQRPRFIATVPGQGYRFTAIFSSSGWSGGLPAEEPRRN